ncbi:MAG: PAS domain S-box protein [Ignavibacteriae bacterium]|nr:PAS domain S-box protein [Ignavibacteriota bacterium]
MKNLNILIVDDSFEKKKIIIDTINSINHYSYKISETSTLQNLHKLISSYNIDVILLNSKIAGWNGISSYNNLEKEFPHIGKIIIIDHEDDPILDVLLKNSSSNYLIIDKFNKDEFFKTIHSVEKWKNKLQEISNTKSFFQATIDSLNELIAIIDESGKIIYTNKSWQIFSSSFSEPNKFGIGEIYFDILNKISVDDFSLSITSTAIKDILNEEKINFNIELPVKINERELWYSLNLTSFNENGEKRIVAAHQNITHLKEAEKAKEISEKVFKHSIDFLFISGLDGYLKEINSTWTKSLGWKNKELLSKPWVEFIHQDDINITKSIIGGRINETECIQFTNRIMCKDNSFRWLTWNLYSYPQDNIIFGVARDITDNKRIELELLRSQKNAEKSDRLKSEFLTQISHEIRTPLNSLLGFASLIKLDLGDNITEDLTEAFQHMDLAGKRIFRTIELLIKISELHTDNYEPEFCRVNILELLEHLVEEYKPIAEQKNLILKLINSTESAELILDKKSIVDVFSNLIDNAIKFTRKGSVTIQLKQTLFNEISVSVIDTGIGISEKFIGYMFHPFSQETTGYTRKFDGNGLGLALVKQYCDLNKAEIFASSEKGVGSNFTIIFQ